MVETTAQSLLRASNGGHNYLVAVDGSEASELAFKVSMKGLFRPGKDVFNVCTITDARKDYLPFQYRPEYIEEKFQAKIYANAQSGDARFIKKEVEQDKTTKETLWNLASSEHADIIVTGMHGRKGPKEDLTVAGTAVKFLGQQSKTIAIIKDTNMDVNKTNYRFGCLFDSSEVSEKVLRQTLSMMAENDRLTTITVVEPGVDKASIHSKVAAICGQRPFDVVVLENQPSTTIRQRVKDYLKDQDPTEAYVDFVCVGNRGLNVGNHADGENYLGSVAQAMIGFKKLNVIFVP